MRAWSPHWRPGRGGARRPDLWRLLSWAAPVGGTVVLKVVPPLGGHVPDTFVVGVLAVLFVTLVARSLRAAVRQRERRLALVALAAGLLLWAAGSAALNASGAPTDVAFPSPGEWFFLSAYLGFTVFLVLDRRGASVAGAGAWLDAVVLIGGTACVALIVLVTPLAPRYGGSQIPLLVALLYPLLDVALLLLVVGQAALRQRSLPALARVGAALVLLAFCDASLVAAAEGGQYASGDLLNLLWCVGFVLLVDAACAPQQRVRPAAGRGDGGDGGDVGVGVGTVAGAGAGVGAGVAVKVGGAPILGAATVALCTLLVQQEAPVRLLLDVPAVLTLVAAGLRLAIALRQARHVNEALRLSRTDDLTGLPNRRALKLQLEQEGQRSGPVALLLLDLDGFKEVNDTLGHQAGDDTLTVIARRVAAAAGGRATAVRLGGDEFAVLVHDDDPMRLLDHGLRLRDTIRKPVRVDGLDVSLDVSIGVSVRARGTLDVSDLLRQADVAMYQAKCSGGRALLYDPERDDFSRARLRTADSLRRGLDAGEIVVWYQPKIDAATGNPCGAEALVRWQHPTDGLVPPGVFLPAARRAGLMPALTRTVFAQAVADAVAWRREGFTVPVAVNVAPAELLSPTLVPEMLALVRAAALEPGAVVVEVTEDSFLADPERARHVIAGIRAAGVEVSIDDYGTGFSSLSYLRDLPVQELKIDRSFVADLLLNPRNHMIVRTTHELAHGLGMRTVAEGVETAEVAERLRTMGIDVLQGYHFARPMPSAQLSAWLRSQRRIVTVH